MATFGGAAPATAFPQRTQVVTPGQAIFVGWIPDGRGCCCHDLPASWVTVTAKVAVWA
jgi:hypothetical protein